MMIAVSLQRLMNTATSLGFGFLSIGQRVLEGIVGEKYLLARAAEAGPEKFLSFHEPAPAQ